MDMIGSDCGCYTRILFPERYDFICVLSMCQRSRHNHSKASLRHAKRPPHDHVAMASTSGKSPESEVSSFPNDVDSNGSSKTSSKSPKSLLSFKDELLTDSAFLEESGTRLWCSFQKNIGPWWGGNPMAPSCFGWVRLLPQVAFFRVASTLAPEPVESTFVGTANQMLKFPMFLYP